MKNIDLEYHLTNESEIDRKESISESLDLIEQKGLNKLYLSALYNDFYYKGFYEFFINKDLKGAKQCFYLCGRFLEIYTTSYDVQIIRLFSFMFGSLLSDDTNLIKRISYIQINNLLSKKVDNNFPMVIQAILRNDFDEAIKLFGTFKDKILDLDKSFFLALIDGNKKKMESLILQMVSESEHRKRVKKWWIYRETFSENALAYTKLAYIKGFELDIDHPLIPKELLPVRPNDEYWEYDFMKEGKYKDV